MNTTTGTRTAALRLSGISKSFGAVSALRNVDVEILPGEIHALLGENGAGKSTLMAVASGALAPDAGTISIGGVERAQLTPGEALEHGISIVHQTPTLLPDLTVAENLALAIPRALRPSIFSMDGWVREILAVVGSRVSPDALCEDLTIADKQLIEIAKALAIDTKVLILDEPTAPLDQDKVDLLFEKVREIAARGVAIIYITHRIPEVRELAHTVTILRDGEVRGSYDPAPLSDDEIIALIAGRSIEAVFPGKAQPEDIGSGGLVVEHFSGSSFDDVSLTVRPGEIVGLAGVAGNGQDAILRSLAGLGPSSGSVSLGGKRLRLRSSVDAVKASIAFMPADRGREGVLKDFSIRENLTVSSLNQFSSKGLISGRVERERVQQMARDVTIKAPSIETPVSALSGGNQQKVLLARALLSNPKVVLAEEPTQGVDAGARSEIYTELRSAAREGMGILVVSSDALELEGLCDRVLVVSHGSIVAELAEDQVTENNMMQAMLRATKHRPKSDDPQPDGPKTGHQESKDKKVRTSRAPGWLRRSAPSVILAVAIIALTIVGTSANARFLNEFNVASVLLLSAALAFIGLGQLLVIMTGGIDLSVGPLSGFVLVVLSFIWVEGVTLGGIIAGFLLVAALAILLGAINGGLVRGLKFTPVAATLVTYIALQGVSLIMRPQLGGYIDPGVMEGITTKIGPIPVAFVIAVMLAVGLELALRYSRAGMSLRAAGSDEVIAKKIGVRTNFTVFMAYILSALFTMFGGILIVGQIGVGDPTQGVTFTLASITAVVIAGTALRGGSGSAIAVLLGAVLIQVVLSVATFLRLETQWQHWLQGGIVLGAAVLYLVFQQRKATQTAS